MSRRSPRLSIIIKALNEERLIDACLKSVVGEAERLDGEVILVDSISTDKTVEIAARFPIRIVQFRVLGDRGCGAAIQLGYQFARGDFIYLLDGDMALEPGFVEVALRYLESHPEVAGVGGRLIDLQVKTAADKRRVAHYGALQREQDVLDLGGGGLYRRSAIESVGYAAHRWLPAGEEAELGARLIAAGWRIVRLPHPSVKHTGHDESKAQMLIRLWRSRRLQAYGMLLRMSAGTPWWWRAARTSWYVFIAPMLYLLTLLIAIVSLEFGLSFRTSVIVSGFFLWAGVLGVMVVRKRDLAEGVFAIGAWHVYSLAALIGFSYPIGDPFEPIDSRVIQ